jgi:tetratricopeptide (TPR) repeat protein
MFLRTLVIALAMAAMPAGMAPGGIIHAKHATAKERADALYRRGLAEVKTEHMERAIADLTRAIELDPDHVDALNARGDAHHRLRRYDAAAKDYMRAMRLGRPDHDPAIDLYWYELRDVSDLFDQRGFDFWRDNQCGRAIEELDESIKIDPTHPDARNLRAAAKSRRAATIGRRMISPKSLNSRKVCREEISSKP